MAGALQVKRLSGVKRTSAVVSEALLLVAHDTLRWSGRLPHLATYCAMLLEVGATQSDIGSLARRPDLCGA